MTIFGSMGYAQSPEALEKIESARIALISERLGLTPEQAEKFWPLYREYLQERETLQRDFIQSRNRLSENKLSEDEAKSLYEKGLEIRERQVDLDRRYSERLNRVITTRQLMELRKAENDFRRMLLERLERRNEQLERQRQRQQRRDNNY